MPRSLVLALGVAGAGLLACARPYSPPGGEPDKAPPRVIATTPEPMAVVPGLDGPVVFRFDEQVSEQGIEDAVLVSPETGEVKVDKGRSELSISIEGGWKPDQIYRIVIRPVLRDRFGNTTTETTDFIFSTGPPIPSTALAGLVTDRITGKPAREIRVEAIRRADSTVYVAVTDTAGLFALRHIPAGAYDVRAYMDQRRNREPDFTEPIDTGTVTLGVRDTVVVTHSLLLPDTSTARLVRAGAADSLAIRLTLDDYIDPLEPLDGVEVVVRRLPDSTVVEVAELIHAHVYEQRLAERRAAEAKARAAADSAAAAEAAAQAAAAAADSAAAAAGAAADSGAVPVDSTAGKAVVGDSVAVPPDSVAVDPVAMDSGVVADTAGSEKAAGVVEPLQPDAPAVDSVPVRRVVGDTTARPPAAPRPGGRAETRPSAEAAPTDTAAEPLPTHDLIVVPAVPLPPEDSFLVTLRGVRNIRGLEAGGGSVEFQTPARSAPQDSAGAAAAQDTAGAAVVPDTVSQRATPVPRDTVPVPPDTIPPDTIPAPRPSRRDASRIP